MAEYYLISQLPSLDSIGDNTPLPITEERFSQLCNQLLNPKVLNLLNKITLIPPLESEKTGSALIDSWNEQERNLRLVLSRVRAAKMKKPFDPGNKSTHLELYKTATEAVEKSNPLEAEKYLLNYRLNFLETLRPMDTFSEDFLFYYALRLKLILRIRQFDTKLGEAAYKNIYKSILNSDKLEA